MKYDFKDKRGFIKDILVGPKVDSVTYITFTKGAVRGNHLHKKTTQYDFVLEGKVRVVTDKEDKLLKEGDSITHLKGTPHAYKAVTSCVMISMTYGPRKGKDFGSDTFKLIEPLI